MTVLSSPSNPKIKQIRLLLQQRKTRQETGLFVVEGIRHVGEACEAGAGVEYLVYSPDQLTSAFARDLVQDQAQRGVPVHAVTAQVFASLADKENPQGLLAVIRQPRAQLSDLSPDNFPWGVALVAPQDPGNIGSILRTIDAVGASGLLLLENSADPFNPGAVRASMGALFWLPVVQASFAEFAAWVKAHAYLVCGTSAHASQDYASVERYPRPLILLMGSERQGLSPEQAAVCGMLVSMPMKGRATSLNLAIATGIMLYDILGKPGAPKA